MINLVEVTKHHKNFQEMFILKNEIVGCAPTGAGTGICHTKKKHILTIPPVKNVMFEAGHFILPHFL